MYSRSQGQLAGLDLVVRASTRAFPNDAVQQKAMEIVNKSVGEEDAGMPKSLLGCMVHGGEASSAELFGRSQALGFLFRLSGMYSPTAQPSRTRSMFDEVLTFGRTQMVRRSAVCMRGCLFTLWRLACTSLSRIPTQILTF